MDMMKRAARGKLRTDKIHHLFIHMGSAQAAPEGYHQGLVVCIAQSGTGLGTAAGKKVAAHRGTGNYNLFRMLIIRAAGLKSHHHFIHQRLQRFRGQSRHHIGFMHCSGHTGLSAVFNHRVTGIAAGANDQIRLKFLQHGSGLSGRFHHQRRCVQIVPNIRNLEGAAEIVNLNSPKGIARFFNKLPFHTPLAAHEQDVDGCIPLLHQPCQGQRWIYMTGRSAAGKNHVHHFSVLCRKSKVHIPMQNALGSTPRKKFLFDGTNRV